MQSALTTPVFRSLVIGGIVLGLGAIHAVSTRDEVTHRLVLDAIEQPNAVYLSAWRNGDVNVTLRGDELYSITFQTRASVSDGCRWLGTETLVPRDSRSFHYDYSETILSCDEGATPALKTPRTGIVRVAD